MNKVRDPADGSWRALDGRALYLEAKAAGVLYQAALRAELTRRVGVAWGPVTRHGQAELAGIRAAVLERFSKRAAQVEAAAEAKLAELEAVLERPLDAAERGRVYRVAVLDTRAPKRHGATDDRSLYDGWAAELADGFGYRPGRLVRQALTGARVAGALGAARRRRPGCRRAGGGDGGAGDVRPSRRRGCRRPTPDVLGGTDAAVLRARVEERTDAVLAGRDVVCLQAPARVEAPAALVRRDGWSVWDPPQQVRYTTTEVLAMEARILHVAAVGSAARVGVVERAVLEAALAFEPRRVGADQLAALGQLTGRGRRVEVLIGPAGSGKTALLRVAARAWSDARA